MNMRNWRNEEISIEELKEKADKLAEQNQSLTILSAIDCIIELAEDSGLCKEFMTWVDRYASYLANRQNITNGADGWNTHCHHQPGRELRQGF